MSQLSQQTPSKYLDLQKIAKYQGSCLQNKMANPNFTWDFETLENESVTVIKWHGFFSVILICLCCIFAIISTSGKSMIIYFILYKAPKRPMNTMILLDQVNTLKTLSINNQNGIFLDWYIADQLGGTIHDHHFLNLGYTHT